MRENSNCQNFREQSPTAKFPSANENHHNPIPKSNKNKNLQNKPKTKTSESTTAWNFPNTQTPINRTTIAKPKIPKNRNEIPNCQTGKNKKISRTTTTPPRPTTTRPDTGTTTRHINRTENRASWGEWNVPRRRPRRTFFPVAVSA